MADLSDADIAYLHSELGTAGDEDDWQERYDRLASTKAVALEVLRQRLADALAAAAAGGVTIPGVISVTAPAQPTALSAQITRIEALLATENGGVDANGVTATSVVAGRFDRVR